MYDRVAVVGLGSLGSHVACEVAELDDVCELVLVDYDRVEKRNIGTSLYVPYDVGQFKVNALAHNITSSINRNIKLWKVIEKFSEKNTTIPKCDLVIDCRDVISSKKGVIDVRLYVSGRQLVLDFRKRVKRQFLREGRYRSQITKSDLKRAAVCFSDFMESKYFGEYITNGKIHMIGLDLLSRVIGEQASKALEKENNPKDLIYEGKLGEDRIANLASHIFPIMKTNNEHKYLPVYLGDHDNYTGVYVLTQTELKTPDDVVNFLVKLVNMPGARQYPGYLINIDVHDGGPIIELIPETGAA